MTATNYDYFSGLFKTFADWNPFEMMRQYSFDMDTVVNKHKRHSENVSDTQRMVVENVQAIAKRQAEVIQENTARMMDCCKRISNMTSPKDVLAEQANFANEAVTCNIRHLQELTDMATKAQMELLQQMGDAVAKNVNENYEQMKKPRAEKK